jgi:hypothetical protein
VKLATVQTHLTLMTGRWRGGRRPSQSFGNGLSALRRTVILRECLPPARSGR